MSEILQAIEFHLGRKMNGHDWNYYSVLGLEPTATLEEIKAGLKTSAAAWNASDRKTHPGRAQKVAQILREAQATLLDAEKKDAYDQQLRTPSELEFFSFDPMASFDPSQLPAQNFQVPWHESEARFVGLVAVMAPAQRVPEPLRTNWTGNNPGTPSLSAGAIPMVATGPHQGAGPSSSNAAARIQALKRKRQRNQIITVSAILIAAIGFLSYAAFQFAASQKRLAKQETPQNVAPTELQREFEEGMREQAAKQADQTPPPSDLPTLPVGDPSNSPPDNAATNDPAMSPSPFDIKPIELPADLAKPPGTFALPDPEMPKSDVPATPQPAETSSNAANKEKWVAAMKGGREALSKTDFAAFAKAMESAVQMPMTPEMEAQQKRLDQVGQLYQMAVDAMREARSKTRGTEEITVGKNLVNIVEVTDEAIVVRVAGKNERYSWNQLPLGLALAMSDLTLSDREPTDLAARAVYLSLAPNKTGLYDKKIKEFFDKSLGKGEIRSDLPQVFTDSYE
ncbi:Chaperone protein DnaJ [Pirellula sp. SH-Sr6A]|uniref:DnaJ domain-containing protein n=1 Tax=Pirellula sp. SH-Sr6A TaxID=1632865 RepID=UPI00078EDFB0|nr:DnaJ domain-containing protein [Pirellula sp. SH-Sr6A]AMV32371.1 Chaperone protein DnaJ [Pirellula sp. SH-Sr6A]